MPAQLLVSVRSPQEATAALDGGAQIIDIKEPQRGSLGCCDNSVITDIVRVVRQRSPHIPVSAALGEVAESGFADQPSPEATAQLDLVKSGLSGLHPGSTPWTARWQQYRRQFTPTTPSPAKWVAVSYADAERARAPAPLDVLKEGHRAQCPVLLIDTFDKDGTTLFDWLRADDLLQIRQQTRQYQMKLALAGRISAAELPQVMAIDPDIVAVRGAACERGRRTATVSAERVRELAHAMDQAAVITS